MLRLLNLIHRTQINLTKKRANQKGAALVNVLVLLFIVITLSTVVATSITLTANTAKSTTGNTQANAAAQAGIDDAYVTLYNAVLNGTTASMGTISSNNPNYTVTFAPAGAGVMDITSVGSYDGESSTIIASVSFEAVTQGEGNGAGGSDLEFYSSANVTFNGGTIIRQPGMTTPIINLAQGNLTCQNSGLVFDGNIILWDGNFNFAQSSCKGNGDVYVNGDALFSQYCAGISGNLYVTGNLTFTGACPVTGNLYVQGNLTNTVWNMEFKGNVYVNGNITTQGGAKFGKNVYTNGSFKANGNAVEIRGDLISSSTAADFYFGLNQYNKYVTAKNVHINGRIQSGSSEPALTGGTFLQNQNLPVRTEPTNLTSQFPDQPRLWYSYIKPTQLDGYTWRNESCSLFNNSTASGWNMLASLNAPTVFDLGNCNVVGSWRTQPVVVSDDVIIFGSAFQLESMTFTAASGKTPKIHFIVPDGSDAPGAQCVSNPTTSNLQGVQMGTSTNKSVSGIIYSPCTVNLRWNNAWWRGVIYANSFLIDTDSTLEINPMTLPGALDIDGTGGSNTGSGNDQITDVNMSFISKRPG